MCWIYSRGRQAEEFVQPAATDIVEINQTTDILSDNKECTIFKLHFIGVHKRLTVDSDISE